MSAMALWTEKSCRTAQPPPSMRMLGIGTNEPRGNFSLPPPPRTICCPISSATTPLLAKFRCKYSALTLLRLCCALRGGLHVAFPCGARGEQLCLPTPPRVQWRRSAPPLAADDTWVVEEDGVGFGFEDCHGGRDWERFMKSVADRPFDGDCVALARLGGC